MKPPRNQDPDDAEMRRISTEGPRTAVGDHFILREFQCSDGTDILLLHPVLTKWLNRLRKELGPISINSGFRTHAYNEKIGGARRSGHLVGMAADVVAINATNEKVLSFAKRHDFGGIGQYQNFLHLDVFGNLRRWDRT